MGLKSLTLGLELLCALIVATKKERVDKSSWKNGKKRCFSRMEKQGGFGQEERATVTFSDNGRVFEVVGWECSWRNTGPGIGRWGNKSDREKYRKSGGRKESWTTAKRGVTQQEVV